MINKLIHVWVLSSLFLFTACQEFVHDSFDTFSGRVVSESGQPISGVELVFTQDIDFTDFQNPRSKSIIYRMITDSSGKFKFVIPSKNLDNFYFIQINQPYLFEVDFGGEKDFRNFIEAFPSDRDAFGVVSLGDLIVVEK